MGGKNTVNQPVLAFVPATAHYPVFRCNRTPATLGHPPGLGPIAAPRRQYDRPPASAKASRSPASKPPADHVQTHQPPHWRLQQCHPYITSSDRPAPASAP